MLLGEGGGFEFESEDEKNGVRSILQHPSWKEIEKAFLLKSVQAQEVLSGFQVDYPITEWEVGRRFGNAQRAVRFFDDVVSLLKEEAIGSPKTDEEENDDMFELEAYDARIPSRKE